METVGSFEPASTQEVHEAYEAVESTAKEVVRAVTRTMGFDGEEYDNRVTDDVIQSAQDALFASRLQVQIGTREEYEQWREAADYDIEEVGSEHVENVVWHAGPGTQAVAATFQDEADAAVETLRRQAYGRIYKEILEDTQ